MTLFLISFLAGVLTVLAPCILPLLPVVVGGSLGAVSGKPSLRRAIVVTLALGVSVIVFTLLLKASTLLIDIPEYAWRWFSGGIILAFGLVTLFPGIWERVTVTATMQRKSNEILSKGFQKQTFWGDVVVGAALGPVFSTCSPTYFIVLATVLPVSPLVGMVYLLAYVTGLCLMLLLIAFVGQRIMMSLGVAADPRGWFKRTLGVLFILVGVFIISGADRQAQSWLITQGIFDVTKIEQYLLQEREKGMVPAEQSSTETDSAGTSQGSFEGATNGTNTLQNDIVSMPSENGSDSAVLTPAPKKSYVAAQEISTPDGFVNTGGQSITLEGLRAENKIVLVDFWTYSCINCQRTIPYLNAWYAKYKNQGLEIVGIHTPEFAFEHKIENVEDAVGRFVIKYPVVLDNDYSTWKAYKNNFWPRKYLIDLDGNIIYDHIGEGAYDETEKAIQTALQDRAKRLNTTVSVPKDMANPQDVVVVDTSKVKSPEIYFGALRNQNLGNGLRGERGTFSFELPSTPLLNVLYLNGTWGIGYEYAENIGAGSIVFKYSAKNVYFVASAENATDVEIFIDGQPITAAMKGADVSNSGNTVTIGEDRSYHLVGGSDYGEHILEIKASKGGLKAFTFTFG